MTKFNTAAMVAALLCASASAAFAQDAAPPATPAAPAPAAPVPAAPVVQAPTPAAPAVATSAMGKIVFFRPTRLSGAIYTYHVVETAEDGKHPKGSPEIGDLPNGGSFTAEVEPGIHNYNISGPMAVNKADDRFRLEVEPGETYYVEQTVRMGVMTGGFRLVAADAARFTKSIKPEKQK